MVSDLHIHQVASELRCARALVAELPARHAFETLYRTLRRVRGSLDLLGLPGTAVLAQELCETVLRAARADASDDARVLDGVEQGVEALADFLDQWCDGRGENPLGMRGFVDALRAARGAERSPTQAFFNSPVDARPVELPATEQVALDRDLRDATRRLRAAYQRGLVEWLRGTDRSTAFQRIDAVVTELEALCTPYPQATLWWVARAAVACIREDGSSLDGVLKSAFSKLDRQIKHLTERGARALGDAPPPALLEQLLCGIALGDYESAHVRAVCEAYGLRGMGGAAASDMDQRDTEATLEVEAPRAVDDATPLAENIASPDTAVDATFIEEIEDLLEALRVALPAMESEGAVPLGVVFTTARAGFAELARLARGVECSPVADLATAFEALLNGVERQDAHDVSPAVYQLACEGRAQSEVLVQRMLAGADDDGAWRDLVERAQSVLGHAAPLPGAAQVLAVDDALPFIDDSVLLMVRSTDVLSRWCDNPNNAEYLAELRRGLYALGRDSELGRCAGLGELCHALDALLAWLEAETHGLSADDYVETVARAHEMLCVQVSAVRAGRPIPDGSDLTHALSGLLTLAPSRTTSSTVHPPVERQPGKAGSQHPTDVVMLAGALNAARLQVEQHTGLMRENLDALALSVKKLRKRVQSLPVDAAPAHFGRAQSMSATLRAAEVELSRRELESSAEDMDNLHELMAGLSDQSQVLLEQQAKLSLDLQRGLLVSRSVPVSSLATRFEQCIQTAAAALGKSVALVITGHDCEVHRSLSTQLVALVEHLLRNAVEHGVEHAHERTLRGKPAVGTVTLCFGHEGEDLVVSVSDDGSGLDPLAVRTRAREQGLLGADAHCEPETMYRLVLQPGLSTAAADDTRGMGLTDVVTGVERCRGVLTIDHEPGHGASFTLRVPATTAMAEVLLVEAAGERLAIPVNAVESVASMSRQEAEQQIASEAPVFAQPDSVHHPLAYLGELFDTRFGQTDPSRQRQALVVVKSAYRRLAMMVDALHGRDVVMLEPVAPPLSSVPLVGATTVLGDGKIALVLDAPTLVRTLSAGVGKRFTQREEADAAPTVMVVDESRAIRRETGQLLRRNGMQVLTASNGVDALRLLRERCPDVMLLDAEVPGLNGMELKSTMRHDGALGTLPIVMLVSGRVPPREAHELGVTQWLGKPFREGELLAAIDGALR